MWNFVPLPFRSVWSRKRRTACAVEVLESLEERLVPAELSGVMTTFTSLPVEPGQVIQANWFVSNNDFDTIFTSFQVSFWLSRDGAVSFDDRFLGSRTLPFGFPGLFTTSVQTEFLTLPVHNDPYWGSDTSYQLLMVTDALNDVFEFNEFDNQTSGPLILQFENGGGGGGGGGGGTIGSLNELPATGVPAGTVLNDVSQQLQILLKEAAQSQKELKTAVKGAIPTVEKTLTVLASRLRTLVKQLKPVMSGTAESVTLAPGQTFTRANLDLVERYLQSILPDSVTSLSQGVGPSLSRAARTTESKTRIPIYDDYQDFKKWVERTEKSISDSWEAVKNYPEKVVGQIAALFGQSAKKAGQAELEAKAVTEDRSQAKPRIQELQQNALDQNLGDFDALTSDAPDRLSDASDQVSNLMREIENSLSQISDEILDGKQVHQNNSLKGTWAGDCSRDGLNGTIRIVFRANGNKVTGTTFNTFYFNGQRDSVTKGQFTGALDENNNFRGTITLRNKSGDSGQVPLLWFVNGDQLTGNLFEDTEIGRRLTFTAIKQ